MNCGLYFVKVKCISESFNKVSWFTVFIAKRPIRESRLKIFRQLGAATLIFAAAMFISGCEVNGQQVFNDQFLASVNGSEEPTELTLKIRQALRNNGQTAIYNIKVSLLSEDSIKLSGYVPDSATLHEAERVAYSVEGVRIVANGLVIR